MKLVILRHFPSGIYTESPVEVDDALVSIAYAVEALKAGSITKFEVVPERV